MKTHVIYLPGLGEAYDPFRTTCLSGWKVYGVSVDFIPLDWTDGKSFKDKYDEVLLKMKQIKKKRIVIIGESAGATLALYIAKNHPEIARVITICGVVSPKIRLAPRLRRRSPALVSGVVELQENDRSVETISLRAFIDPVVSRQYSIAKGATERVLWSVGHFFTISLCLTVLSPYVVYLARRQS